MAMFKTNLTDKELLQTQEMSHELWGGGRDLDARVANVKKRLDYLNGSLFSMCAIVDDKDVVLTSMKQYFSKLSYGDQEFAAVGLGAIFTNEKFRKLGWAKKLISLVLDEAKEEGYQCSYLFSDIGEKYYEQFGFVPLPSTDFISSVEFLPTQTTLEGVEAGPNDVAELVAFFQNRLSGDLFRVLRDKSYWNFFIDLNGRPTPLVLKSKGSPIGYMTFSVIEDKLWLDECIIEPSMEQEALGYLRRVMEKHHAKTLQGWHHPQFFPSLKRELVPRKKANPMVYFFDGEPKDWSPEKTWLGSFDHF